MYKTPKKKLSWKHDIIMKKKTEKKIPFCVIRTHPSITNLPTSLLRFILELSP